MHVGEGRLVVIRTLGYSTRRESDETQDRKDEIPCYPPRYKSQEQCEKPYSHGRISRISQNSQGFSDTQGPIAAGRERKLPDTIEAADLLTRCRISTSDQLR